MQGQLNLIWTAEDEKRKQDNLAKHFNLGFWYGTDCKKCCGVFPKFETSYGFELDNCWYECQVCHRKSKRASMPWIAREDWNARTNEHALL